MTEAASRGRNFDVKDAFDFARRTAQEERVERFVRGGARVCADTADRSSQVMPTRSEELLPVNGKTTRSPLHPTLARAGRGMPKRKPFEGALRLEPLEERITPAAFALAAGANNFTFTQADSDAIDFTITLAGGAAATSVDVTDAAGDSIDIVFASSVDVLSTLTSQSGTAGDGDYDINDVIAGGSGGDQLGDLDFHEGVGNNVSIIGQILGNGIGDIDVDDGIAATADITSTAAIGNIDADADGFGEGHINGIIQAATSIGNVSADHTGSGASIAGTVSAGTSIGDVDADADANGGGGISGTVEALGGAVGNVDAEFISGTSVTATGNIGDVNVTGATGITGLVDAGGDINSITSWAGSISGTVHAGGDILDLNALLIDAGGTVTAGGDIGLAGGVDMIDGILGDLSATGDIGDIDADSNGDGTGPISGTVHAGGDIGNVNAEQISGNSLTADGSIGDIDAYDGITGLVSAGTSIGDIDADSNNDGIGAISGTVQAGTDIGDIFAGEGITGSVTATTGDIGLALGISADHDGDGTGAISGTVHAGTDIGDVSAEFISGNSLLADGNIGNINVDDGITGLVDAGGNIGNIDADFDADSVGPISGHVEAGGTIGNIWAELISGTSVVAGGNIGNISADDGITGPITSTSGLIGNIDANADGDSIGPINAVISAADDIGTVDATSINGSILANQDGGSFGDIGVITVTGDITDSTIEAADALPQITASAIINTTIDANNDSGGPGTIGTAPATGITTTGGEISGSISGVRIYDIVSAAGISADITATSDVDKIISGGASGNDISGTIDIAGDLDLIDAGVADITGNVDVNTAVVGSPIVTFISGGIRTTIDRLAGSFTSADVFRDGTTGVIDINLTGTDGTTQLEIRTDDGTLPPGTDVPDLAEIGLITTTDGGGLASLNVEGNIENIGLANVTAGPSGPLSVGIGSIGPITAEGSLGIDASSVTEVTGDIGDINVNTGIFGLVRATVNIGDINSDADGDFAGPIDADIRAGDNIGVVSATSIAGSLHADDWDGDGVGDDGVGDIGAGPPLTASIKTTVGEIGGDIFAVNIIDIVSAAGISAAITATGDVDNIISGGASGNDISGTINIAGDLDLVDAGMANITGDVDVNTAVGSSPLVHFISGGIRTTIDVVVPPAPHPAPGFTSADIYRDGATGVIDMVLTGTDSGTTEIEVRTTDATMVYPGPWAPAQVEDVPDLASVGVISTTDSTAGGLNDGGLWRLHVEGNVESIGDAGFTAGPSGPLSDGIGPIDWIFAEGHLANAEIGQPGLAAYLGALELGDFLGTLLVHGPIDFIETIGSITGVTTDDVDETDAADAGLGSISAGVDLGFGSLPFGADGLDNDALPAIVEAGSSIGELHIEGDLGGNLAGGFVQGIYATEDITGPVTTLDTVDESVTPGDTADLYSTIAFANILGDFYIAGTMIDSVIAGFDPFTETPTGTGSIGSSADPVSIVSDPDVEEFGDIGDSGAGVDGFLTFGQLDLVAAADDMFLDSTLGVAGLIADDDIHADIEAVRGSITGLGGAGGLIQATGSSPGDITGNVTAGANITADIIAGDGDPTNGVGGGSILGYIQAGTWSVAESEANDTSGTANSVAILTGVEVTGVIGAPGDVDFFSFTTTGPDTIYIDVDADVMGSFLDPVVTLIDTDGSTVLASNDDSFSGVLFARLDSFVAFELPAAGTYYISITDWGGGGGGGYTYSMNLELASQPGGYISGNIIADTDIGDSEGAVDITTDFGDSGDTTATPRTQENTIIISTGDFIAADEWISGDIRAGDDINSTIVAGLDSTVSEGDDINGSISAGLDPGISVGDIHGDIVANDDITAPTISSTNDIHGFGANTRLLIAALGASAGDITADIVAGDDIDEADIDAGSGSGGNITGNIMAGTLDPTGDIFDVTIEADQNIGIAGLPNTQVISAANDIYTTSMLAGLARDNGAIPDMGGFLSNPGLSGVGNIMVDVTAGGVIGGGGGAVAGTSSDVVIAADGNIGEDSLIGAELDTISAGDIGADNLASSFDVIINAGFGRDGADGDGYDRFGTFSATAVGDATSENIFSNIAATSGSITDVGIFADDNIGRSGGEGDSFILATDSILGTGDNLTIIDAGNEDAPDGSILSDIVAGFSDADPDLSGLTDLVTGSGSIARVLISADDNIGEATQTSIDNGIILAAGDIVDVRIQAGSGTNGLGPAVVLPTGSGAPGTRANILNSLGGSIYVNIVAGADGTGSIDPTIIEADDDIGAAPEGTNVIFSGTDIGGAPGTPGAPFDVIIDAGNVLHPGGNIYTDIIAFNGSIQDTLITADDNIGATGQILGAGAGTDQIDSDGLPGGDNPQGIIQAGNDIVNVEIGAGEISIHTATNAGAVGRDADTSVVDGGSFLASVIAGTDGSGSIGTNLVLDFIVSGADGIAQSVAAGDDVQVTLPGIPGLIVIDPGLNGVINSPLLGDDVITPIDTVVADSFNLSADDDLGESFTGLLPPTRRENNIISAADNISIYDLTAGDNLATLGMDAENTGSAGDLSIDVIAGTLFVPNNAQSGVGTTGVAGLPVGDNIADTTDAGTDQMPQLENDDDNIHIIHVNVAVADDAGEVAGPFIADAPGTPATLEGNGNINGTFAAASDLILPNIDLFGNIIGDDGRPPGGSAFHAGLSPGGGVVILGISTPGDFTASVTAGTFVPFDNSNATGTVSAIDPGPFQAGTVLSLGTIAIAIDAGRIIGSGMGVNGADGINLDEVLSGTEGLADGSFKPTAQFATTGDLFLQLRAHGRPSGGSIDPDPTDGDIIDLSVTSFGSIIDSSSALVEITKFGAPAFVPGPTIAGALPGISATANLDVNMIMANIDAITSLDSSPGNPSHPNTNLPLNDPFGDLNVNLTASGGALTGGVVTAGLDPFVLIDTGGGFPPNAPSESVAQTPIVTSFLEAFGFGSILRNEIRANDPDPTDGLEDGDIRLQLVAAGQDIDTLLVAQDDIIFLDNAFAGSDIKPGEDSDIAAGLSSVGIPNGLDLSGFGGGGGPSFLFPGGNLNGNADGHLLVAGDDILHGSDAAPQYASIAAMGGFGDLANPADDTGNFNGIIVSGAEDQIAETILSPGGTPNPFADIRANISASGDVNVVNAGDVLAQFGGVTAGGLAGPPGTGRGSFFGTVTAGAGIDLLLGTADDQYDLDLSALGNSNDESGTIEAIVADTDIGSALDPVTIAATGDINFIGNGFDGLGSDIFGNISTAGDLVALVATGNIGAPGDLIAVAGDVGIIQAGNPTSDSGVILITDPNPRTGTIGVLGADIFVGGDVGDGLAGSGLLVADTNGDGAPDTLAVPVSGDDNDGILAGADITGSLFLGENTGIADAPDTDPADLIIEEGGGIIHTFDITWTGAAIFEVANGVFDGGPGANFDVVLVDPFDVTVGLDVTTTGTVGINELIVGDGFRGVNINQGSVDSILVSDDLADFTRVTPVAPPALPPVVSGSLLALSIPESAFGDDVFQLDVVGSSTVSGNIGSFDIEGSLFADVTSTFGNIGNITVGHDIDGVTITALEGSIGNITTLFGSIAPTSSVDVLAGTGIGNMEAAEGSIGETATVTVQTTFGNVGSFTAEENISNLDVDVFAGSLAADTATDTVFVPAAGIDGATPSADDVHVAFYARTGSIDGLDITVGGGTPVGPGSLGIGFILAGQHIIDSRFVAQNGSIGDIFAGGNIDSSHFEADNGSVGVNPIFANFSIVGGVFIAKGPGPLGNVDTLIAHQGSITLTSVRADNDSRGLYAYSDIGPGVTVNAGNDITGPPAAVQAFFNGVFGTHMGPEAFLAYTGSITGVTADAHGNIGAIRASADITGSTFTAETGDIATGTDAAIVGVAANWIQSDVGDINSTFVAGGDIVTDGVNIGSIDAVGGSILAGTLVRASGAFGIGNIDASENIDGTFTAENGNIGNITSDSGDIGGTNAVFTAAGNVGNIDAATGAILSGTNVTAGTDIGTISASQNITGGFTAQTGSIGNITSDAGNISGAFTAGTNVGDIEALAGSILATTVVDAVGNIGAIHASLNIDGSFTAQRGDIGDITSDAGDIGGSDSGAVFTAGGNIGNITAATGSLLAGTAVTAGTDIGAITVFGDVVDGVSIIAGNNIGAIDVGGDVIDGSTITAGGDIASITVDGTLGVDDEIAAPSLPTFDDDFVDITAGGNIGAITVGINLTDGVSIIAGGSIGDISVGGILGFDDDPLDPVDNNVFTQAVITAGVGIGTVTAGSDIDEVTLIAQSGSIGDVTATAGSITGAAIVHAQVDIGDVDASLDIDGEFTAEEGFIGNLIGVSSDAGDITGVFSAGISILGVTAVLGSVTGVFSAGVGGIGPIVAGDSVTGSFTSSGPITSVTADTGNISGRFIGGDIGDIGAMAGAITSDASFTSVLGIGDVFTSGDIDGSFDAQGGDILSVTSDTGDIYATFMGTGSIGPITATAGAIDATVDVSADITSITASGDIEGSFTAQTGDIIFGVLSDAGDIFADINAGGTIGPIDAVLGGVFASITAGLDITSVDAGTSVGGLITAQGGITGGITADTGGIFALATAGGSIGPITAVAGVIDAQITADVNIGDVSASGDIRGSLVAQTGDIGTVTSDAGHILANIAAGGSIGAIDAVIGSVSASITAGTDIASVSAGAAIGGTITAQGNIAGGITADTGDILATVTVGGSIGDISAVAGQINAQITADVNIGDVDASGSIRGALTAQTGNIGDVTSEAGDILAEISAGLSIGAVDASIGNVSGTLTAGLNITSVDAGTNISGVITAQTGSIGNITADAGDITAAITAGVGIGDVRATTGAIGAAITADASIGAVSASGDIGGTITAETGSIGTVTSDSGDLLADLSAGANIGDITVFGDIVDGAVSSEGMRLPGGTISAGANIGAIDVGNDVLDGVSITAGGNVTSITVDGTLGLDDEIEPPPSAGSHVPFDPDFVDITVGGDIGPIIVGEDLTDGVSIFAGGSIGDIAVGRTLGLNDDLADPFDNNTFTQAVITAGVDIGAITAGSDINEATITAQAGSILNVAAAAGSITGSASIHAGANIGVVSASRDILAPIVAETGDIAGIASSAGAIDAQVFAGGTIGAVTAGGDIGGAFDATNMDGFRTFTGDISVAATATDDIGDLVADAGVIDSEVDAGDNLGDIIASGDLSGSYAAEAGNIGDVISVAGDITDIDLTAGSNIDDIVAATGSITVTTAVTAGGAISTIFASEDIEGEFTTEAGDIGVNAYDPPSADPALTPPAYPTIPASVVGAGVISQVGDISADFIAGHDIGDITAIVGDITSSITAGHDIHNITAPIGTIDAELNANGSIGVISAQEIILGRLNAEDVSSITIDVDGVMTTLSTGGTPGILDVFLTDTNGDGEHEFVLKLTNTTNATALGVTTSDTSLVNVASIRGTDGSNIGSIDVEGSVDEINFVGDISGRVDIRDGGDLGEIVSFGDIGTVQVWNGTVGDVTADANVDGVGTIAEVRANEFLGVISGWIDPTQTTFTFNEGRAAVDSALTVGGGGRAFVEVNNSVDVDLYDLGVTLTAVHTDLDSVGAPAADTVGAITVNGGDLISADLAGSLGSVDVNQLAPTGGGGLVSLSVVGSITGTVLADDGIGSISTEASIAGPTINADADGDNIGDLGSVFAGDDINANIQAQNIGAIAVRGDAGDVIAGNITSVGDIDMIDSGEDGDVTGIVTAGRIRVDSPLFTIRDGGVIYNFDLVTGPGVASTAIAGNVGALTVNNIDFRGTDTTSVFELTTSDAVTGADSTILANVQDISGSNEDFGSITIEGNVNSVTNFDDVGALNVEGSLSSAVNVAGDLGELNVGFNLAAAVTAGGAIGDVTAGDNVSNSIVANDGIAGVYAGDNITSPAITADADGDNVGDLGSVVAGGGIGSAVTTVAVTGANVGSIVSGGVVGDDIYADITSGGDLDAVNAGAANYFGAISAAGVVFAPSLEITEANVTTALSVTSGPGVASVTISTLAAIDVEFTTSGLGGTDDTTAFEITTIDARTGADVDLLADVNTINVETGDIGSISVEGDVDAINVNTFAAPPRPSTPFASAGDIFVEGSLGATNVEGDIGELLVGDDITGPTTATNGSIGDVAALNVNGAVTANIDVGSVTAAFDINGDVTATLGSIGDVAAGNDVNGDVTAAENINSVVAGNDVNGNVTATIGDIGVVHAGDDVNGDVTAGGNIGIVSTDGQVGNDINGDVTAGGDLDEVNAGLGALNGSVSAGAIVGNPVLIANDAIISFVISGTADFYALSAPAGGGIGIVLGVTDITTDFAIITTDAGLSGAINGDALLVTVASITTSAGTDIGSITIEGNLDGTISNIGAIGDIDDTAETPIGIPDTPLPGIHVDDGIFIEGSILSGSTINIDGELEALFVGDIDDLTGSITSSSVTAGGDIGLIQVGDSILGASTITSTGGNIREVNVGVDILGTSAAARTVISASGSIGYVGAGNDIGRLIPADPGADGIFGSSDDFRAAGGQLDVLIIGGTGTTVGPDGIPGTVDDIGIGDVGFVEADTDGDGFGAIAAAMTTTIDGDRRTPTPQWISFRNDAGAGAAGLTGPGLYQTVAVGKGGDTANVTIAYGVVTEVELVQLKGGTIDLRTFITNEAASGTRLDPFPNDPFGPANRLAKDPFRFKVGDAKHDPIDDQLRNDDFADLGDVFLAKDIRRGGKNKSRDLGEIIAEGDIRSIDNHIRDIKTIYADGSIGTVHAGRDIKKGVTAGGEIGRLAADRDIKKPINAGDDIGYRDPAEDFNGDIVFAGQEIADPGIHAGRKLKSPIESGGSIGAITAGSTIKVGGGSLHAEGDILYVDGGKNIKGAIRAEGSIGTIIAKDYIRASIRAQNGDIGFVESGEVMGKEIFAGGNIGTLRALDRSIRDVEARGNIDFIQTGRSVGNVIAGGDIGVVVAGQRINEVVAGGDIGFIDSGTKIRRVAAGGDIGMRPVPDDVPVAVPDGVAIRVGDSIDGVSAGGSLLNDIVAGTAIGSIQIGGDTLGDIIVGDTVIVPAQ